MWWDHFINFKCCYNISQNICASISSKVMQGDNSNLRVNNNRNQGIHSKFFIGFQKLSKRQENVLLFRSRRKYVLNNGNSFKIWDSSPPSSRLRPSCERTVWSRDRWPFKLSTFLIHVVAILCVTWLLTKSNCVRSSFFNWVNRVQV